MRQIYHAMTHSQSHLDQLVLLIAQSNLSCGIDVQLPIYTQCRGQYSASKALTKPRFLDLQSGLHLAQAKCNGPRSRIQPSHDLHTS